MEENKTEQGYCYKYPRPAVTTDVVLFAMVDSQMKVLLIQRGRDPYKGQWAFPGGFLNMDESAAEGAMRELEEETGYVSNDWKHIYTIPSNPTIADNYAFLYYADNCEKVSNQHLDSTEFLEVKEYTEDEIDDLIKNNEFVQPIHLMGWLMVKKGVL